MTSDPLSDLSNREPLLFFVDDGRIVWLRRRGVQQTTSVEMGRLVGAELKPRGLLSRAGADDLVMARKMFVSEGNQKDWSPREWDEWRAAGCPLLPYEHELGYRPPNTAQPWEPDSRLPQQHNPEVVVPKYQIPAGFSLNEKPRPKPRQVDAILEAYEIRPRPG